MMQQTSQAHNHSAKYLSKPMLGYCQLDPYEHTSVKF